MSKKNQVIPIILLFIFFIGIMIAIFAPKNNPSDKSNLEISTEKQTETLEETIKENIPGLYDKDNNLLCTWEESGIDILNIGDYISATYKTDCNSSYYIITNKYPTTTKVIIPKTDRIGTAVFYGCTMLEEITIPEGVKKISFCAFYKCSNLLNIKIPASVEIIEPAVFYGCDKIETIIVSPENKVYDSRDNCNAIIETATNNLIIGCKNTKVVDSVFNIEPKYNETDWLKEKATTTEEGLKIIGNGILLDGSNVSGSFIIPDTITNISSDAFFKNDNLTSIVIPENVKNINDGAFNSCKNLENVEIKSNIEKIPSHAFNNCQNLINVKLPKTIKTIESFAFSYCYNLKTIEIPEGVTTIEEHAFDSCEKLENITLPSTLTTIATGAFSYNNFKSIEIPKGVSEIGRYAFSNCSNLTDVIISEGTTNISIGAFSRCKKLENIILPDTLEIIEYNVFDKCLSLKNIYYTGSSEKWKTIIIDVLNEELENATIIYEYSN